MKHVFFLLLAISIFASIAYSQLSIMVEGTDTYTIQGTLTNAAGVLVDDTVSVVVRYYCQSTGVFRCPPALPYRHK